MMPFKFCGFSSLFTLSLPDGGYSRGRIVRAGVLSMFLFQS
jgi:hypothetical protein